jgi:DNA-binding transcriptional LysR family regulator
MAARANRKAYEMPHLDNILVFVKVAEFESMIQAARALDMPISTVSRKLSALESHLGVSLVRRTTRRVILTSQGREYFNQCSDPLTKLREAEQVLTQTQRKPEGTLALSVPMILSQGAFMDFLSAFSKEHPRIRIDLNITNAYSNLTAENIDVAIRIGHLRDSSVVAVKLGKIVRYVVAATGYMEGRRLPTEPEELKGHDCVMFNAKASCHGKPSDLLLTASRRCRARSVAAATDAPDLPEDTVYSPPPFTFIADCTDHETHNHAQRNSS